LLLKNLEHLGQSMHIKRLSGSVGAEILDVDLVGNISDALIADIRKVWLESGVVFFRDQNMTMDQFQSFAQRFGEIVEYPFVKGLPDHPMIIPVLKLPHEKNNFGGIWHTDTTYLQTPPMATMLIAEELPPYGGDTLFSSNYAAYEALSPDLQRVLQGLRGVNSSAKATVTKTREDRVGDSAKEENVRKELVSEHPVVRTHPETGRKALYVNPGHTMRFVGWTEEESAPLLEYLYQHQVKPEFTCRFSWTPKSIALWDNRCVMHNPVNDYHGHKRLLYRITLKGDTPA
jgi:taurine dioxygenase